MKSLFTFVLICICFFPIHSFAQEKIKESTETIGDLKGNALTIHIIQADEKDIKKEWKSIMKSYGGKVKTKGNRIYTTDARIESISSGNVQVNAEIGDKKDKRREFTVIFKSEKGVVSSSNDVSGYTAADMILQPFANKLSTEAASDYKDEQEKLLTALQKDKEKLEKETENLKSDIEDWKEEIKEAEYQIEINGKKLEKKEISLAEQEKRYKASVKDLESVK